MEDAIEISEKDAARDLLVEAIKSLDFYGVEIFVRVNSVTTPFFEEDIKEIVPVGIRKIRLSMCQSKEDIMILDKLLNAVETKHNIKLGSVKRNSKGYYAAEMVAASDRVIAISFGGEDYTASLGINRTKTGKELLFARSTIVNVASAFNIDETDTVWADIYDTDGFIEEIK